MSMLRGSSILRREEEEDMPGIEYFWIIPGTISIAPGTMNLSGEVEKDFAINTI